MVLCPTSILEMGDELNPRLAYVPRVKKGKENYCTACRRCEYGCPVWAIYILHDKVSENEFEKAEV